MQTNKLTGLTVQEVQQRIDIGQDNKQPKAPTRTIGQIIRNNVFTFFNFINLILAILVLAAGSFKNAFFILLVIANTVIGIIQEIRAKQTLEKLSLLNQPKAYVLRDGVEQEIALQDIVQDDILILRSGMQVSADAQLLDGQNLEVDESLLTGESDPIQKTAGDELLAGSFIISGQAYVQVIRVGTETYTAKLADEARQFKMVNSELRDAIDKIIKFVTIIIVPIGIFLAWSQFSIPGATWQDAIMNAVAGIIGMIPEGLVLLTSIAFAAGVVKLAQRKTLVQELPAIETLARVDVLCLDKTGTITEGVLDVNEVHPFAQFSRETVDQMIATFITAMPDANPTQQALLDYYEQRPTANVVQRIAFSSARKWSAVQFQEHGTYILGAPEMVLTTHYEKYRAQIETYASQGQRVLVLAMSGTPIVEEVLPSDIQAVALITLEDRIRQEAPQTLAYFAQQGVSLKVISGDNPVTVAAVAKRAGLVGSENYVDARTLPEDLDQLAIIIEQTTVFGRVTPHQKKLLVQALQSHNHIVAMTGDGVNDVLALKEADCGIAMASGSDATKAVAQLVLLDSNFATLTQAVAEGRRVINNIQRVASLFLVKTLYSFLLSVLTIIIGMQYPFIPIQLSLISTLAVGVPSFFLALTPNNDLIKPGFLRRVLTTVIPAGTAIALIVLSVHITEIIFQVQIAAANTLVVLMAGMVQLIALYRITKPMNTWKRWLVGTMWVAFLTNFLTGYGREFFGFEPLPIELSLFAIVGIIIAYAYILIMTKIVRKYLLK
ncbi:MAG: cation-translocating P-type ATPase [Culicoidibacterales bacterium]